MVFQSVHVDRDMPSPFAVDRADDSLYINPDLANQLDYFTQTFWLLHEAGHIALDTSVESDADAYAIAKELEMNATPETIRKIVAAIPPVLKDMDTNPEQKERYKKILNTVLQYSAERFGDQKAANQLLLLNDNRDFSFGSWIKGAYHDIVDPIGDLAGKALALPEKVFDKVISIPGDILNSVVPPLSNNGGVKGLVSGNQTTTTTAANQVSSVSSSSNTIYWILGAVLVLIVIIVIIVIIAKKTKK